MRSVVTNITIRKLDDDVEDRLRARAASNGRSVEEEACAILRDAVEPVAPAGNLAAAIRARMAPLGGVDLELPQRVSMREPPTFD